jgi:ribosomal protein S18 acetylase RimI-like enzyme
MDGACSTLLLNHGVEFSQPITRASAKTLELASEGYARGDPIIVQHPLHNQIFGQPYRLIDKSIQYTAKITQENISQFRALHEEVLPPAYPDSHYVAFLEQKTAIIVATADFLIHEGDADKELTVSDQIIGFLSYQVKDFDDHDYFGFIGGIASSFKDKPTCHLNTLGVMHEFRQQGFASNMFDILIDRIKSEGKVKTISLYVYDQNNKALEFYLKKGFFPAEHIRVHRIFRGKEYGSLLMIKYI